MLKLQIKEYLEKSKTRPYQLAKIAGVPATSIYRFLKGERGLNLDTAEKIKKIIENLPTAYAA